MKCCAWEYLRTTVAMITTFFRSERAGLDLPPEVEQAGASAPAPATVTADLARLERNSRRFHSRSRAFTRTLSAVELLVSFVIRHSFVVCPKEAREEQPPAMAASQPARSRHQTNLSDQQDAQKIFVQAMKRPTPPHQQSPSPFPGDKETTPASEHGKRERRPAPRRRRAARRRAADIPWEER